MGRYTGPKTKLCRRVGFMIFDNVNVEKAFLKRENVRFQGKKSEYGRRLTEKQKIMHYYGLREKQMRKMFDKARRTKGDTGRNFLILLERRLDNVITQAGLAPSRPAARQIISHGNVLVNGAKVDIASYIVKTGDTVTFRDKPGIQKLVEEYVNAKSGYDAPDWIAVDTKSRTAKIVREPLREDVRLPVNEQLVVEFYSR
ncbi:MAG: 30S ribosomal protein S4 [Planctomycetes bacterium]|nr:30S ribosomal protein S4 [Planctomycetota bacterium]